MLDAGGNVVAQADSQPLDGWYPMSQWLPGQILADHHKLELPDAPASGQLQIGVGLFDEKSLERLPATDLNGKRLDEDQVRFPFVR